MNNQLRDNKHINNTRTNKQTQAGKKKEEKRKREREREEQKRKSLVTAVMEYDHMTSSRQLKLYGYNTIGMMRIA